MKRSLFYTLFFTAMALATFFVYPGVPGAAPSDTQFAQVTNPQVMTRETTIIVQEPPPPLREEIRSPALAPESVWIPGFWGWNNGWVWSPGHWEMPPQRTATWIPGQWLRTDRGWMWQAGRWQQ